MHYKVACILLISSIFISLKSKSDTAVNSPIIDIEANQNSTHSHSMRLLLAIPTEHDTELSQIAHYIAQCLESTSQFTVTNKALDQPKKQQEIKDLFDQNYSLVVFLNETDDKKAFEWRLYDSAEAQMIQGKKYLKSSAPARAQAYVLADQIWPELTKKQSSFCSKIAYVKRIKNTIPGRQQAVVCIADSDGSHVQELITIPGTYVGLYWHNNPKTACLFCSRFTRFNVQLIAANMHQQEKIILNLKGTCLGISLALDNTHAVYCRSGDIWHYSFDKQKKQGEHNLLIKNSGKNMSPQLLPNGDIIFCSDAKEIRKNALKKAQGPQICYYHKDTKAIDLLTKDGYCLGPSYCPETNKIIYSKRIHNTMQLFIYDLNSKEHMQLTHDLGNKINCSWSPCGTYLIFCYQHKTTSRIALMHVLFKKISFITPIDEYCICPAWSPRYTNLPQLK